MTSVNASKGSWELKVAVLLRTAFRGAHPFIQLLTLLLSALALPAEPLVPASPLIFLLRPGAPPLVQLRSQAFC